MAHDNHVIDGVNKDVPDGYSLKEARDYYLNLASGWVSSYPNPVVVEHDGVMVVRDDLIAGTKARAVDLLTSRLNYPNYVYVAPRVGLAGVALCDVAQKKGSFDVTLFMPASKEISDHQAVCIERGATPIFKRIAAMPNLNRAAEMWASEQDDVFFIPLGLKHELATAAIVQAAYTIPEPDEVYVAISTGVLSRALQIAWPNAKFTCVAVARNLKAGEAGRATVISHPFEFQRSELVHMMPPFPSVSTYDAKVYRYVPKNSNKRVLMWNVGSEPVLKDPTIKQRVYSNVPWEK